MKILEQIDLKISILKIDVIYEQPLTFVLDKIEIEKKKIFKNKKKNKIFTTCLW